MSPDPEHLPEGYGFDYIDHPLPMDWPRLLHPRGSQCNDEWVLERWRLSEGSGTGWESEADWGI